MSALAAAHLLTDRACFTPPPKRNRRQPWCYAENPKAQQRLKGSAQSLHWKRILVTSFNILGQLAFKLYSKQGFVPLDEARQALHQYMTRPTAREHLKRLDEVDLIGVAGGRLYIFFFAEANDMERKAACEAYKRELKAAKRAASRREKRVDRVFPDGKPFSIANGKSRVELYTYEPGSPLNKGAAEAVAPIEMPAGRLVDFGYEGSDAHQRWLCRQRLGAQVIPGCEIEAVHDAILEASGNCFLERIKNPPLKTLPPSPDLAHQVALEAHCSPQAAAPATASAEPEQAEPQGQLEDLGAESYDEDDEDDESPEAIRAMLEAALGAPAKASPMLLAIEKARQASLQKGTNQMGTHKPAAPFATAFTPARDGKTRLGPSPKLTEGAFRQLQGWHPCLEDIRWMAWSRRRPEVKTTEAAIRLVERANDCMDNPGGAVISAEANLRFGLWGMA